MGGGARVRRRGHDSGHDTTDGGADDAGYHRCKYTEAGGCKCCSCDTLECPATPWGAVDRWSETAKQITQPGLQAMFLDQRLYLAEGVLQKVDRASMAHGLEVRSPFLDHHIVDLASRLPAKSLWRGRTTKVLMRRMLANRLPQHILERPKKGFGTPIGSWLRGPCSDLLENIEAPLEGLLHPEPILKWVQEHRPSH